MDTQLFKQIATALLAKHYGLQLNDTDLWDDNVVQACIERGLRPFEVIAEHAEETDLHRIDKEGFYGVPSKALITAADEDSVIRELPQE